MESNIINDMYELASTEIGVFNDIVELNIINDMYELAPTEIGVFNVNWK